MIAFDAALYGGDWPKDDPKAQAAAALNRMIQEQEALAEALNAQHDYRAELAQATADSLRVALGLLKDSDRLDFVIEQRTTWYPGRGPGGTGILCYGEGRKEANGATMRDALDVARGAS